jgi:hypothetical protein
MGRERKGGKLVGNSTRRMLSIVSQSLVSLICTKQSFFTINPKYYTQPQETNGPLIFPFSYRIPKPMNQMHHKF